MINWIFAHLEGLIALGSGLIAGVIPAYLKFIRPAVRRHFQRQKYLNEMPTLFEAIKAIEKQVHPNTSTSLYDMVSRVEQSLYVVEQSTWAAFDLLNYPVWRSNEAGECVYASNELAEVIGCDRQDVLTNGWVSRLHPDDRVRVYQEWTDAVKQQRVFRSRYRFVHLDGSVHPVEAQSIPFYNKSSRLAGFIGVLRALPIENY